MSRCVQLAKNGLGTTYPNPLVGSVIVYNNKVIGEGWHYQAGMPHAEVNAISSAKDKEQLQKATIYVSLEPCSHFGKTPPCADLIIASGIKKVVIGSTDPNPKVAGRGIQKLLQAGCDVVVGVLETECDELNKRFFTFHKKKRPYILLKWAETADGFIAPESSERNNKIEPVWITNTYSRQIAHKLRAEEQGIVVGTQTVLDDNPSLTTRDWYGSNPVRVVLDRNLKISKEASVLNDASKTIIVTEKEATNTATHFYERCDFSENLTQQICNIAHKHELQSIIIEGGAKTLQTFIDANLWDEAFVFKGKAIFGKGVKAPVLSAVIHSEENIREDVLQYFKNNPL
ncbi:bifunctional diaminohydroxyphosphoribosylaminopyrimidine deaminase/5-amino-6-(5-phosphoribosylamino)uracil reductase RibD [Ulvibacter litoralis]|uniref:Riboflavin biosynthesis protein RibD n=1 Tax=Ulvibacter litoralis TaxID=227084 RepID=A0A1G7ELF3_9FLAO|nr:bifunctional diaminohydroxyphosphoribosylaminopyrimidine deaminase/5-amino-6-(5-phosphoribosylamino)uracil reductase RibD [Ulvibacter litoralis]GHC54654.1 riboflavin biosynthesis protein RibD [Ulvibacter litoralis]SDE64442.1 diaminohydroxyphosphoribosylaminopyrimidine deaminase / 5-amino-6-(5-phosphoribosylamino)uracil reductase [Ulvibacter litoralis]